MNPLLILAIITASGILLTSPLLPFQTSKIYADDTETNTDQDLSQKNVGSDNSINFNCGENSIGDSASILCGSSPTGTETGEPSMGATLTLTVRNCFIEQGASTRLTICEVVAPPEFTPGRLTCFVVFATLCDLETNLPRISLGCPLPSPGPGPQQILCQRL